MYDLQDLEHITMNANEVVGLQVAAPNSHPRYRELQRSTRASAILRHQARLDRQRGGHYWLRRNSSNNRARNGEDSKASHHAPTITQLPHELSERGRGRDLFPPLATKDVGAHTDPMEMALVRMDNGQAVQVVPELRPEDCA